MTLMELLSGVSNTLIVDIAFLVILAIFLIVGLCKGFVKQIFGALSSVIALVAAYFLCAYLVKFLEQQFGLLTKLAEAIGSQIGTTGVAGETASQEAIEKAVSEFGLPAFIADYAKSQIGTDSSLKIYQLFGNILGNLILSAGCFIVLYILLRLVLMLLCKLLQSIVKAPGLNALDRILGMLLSLIKGVLVLYVIIFIVDVIPVNEGFVSIVKEAISGSTIGAFLQNHNLFSMAMTWIAEKFGLVAAAN